MKRNKKRKLMLVACLSLLLFAGVFVWRDNQPQHFLKNSDEFVFYTIQPDVWDFTKPEVERFRNHKVLGKVKITSPNEKATLVDALFYAFNGRLQQEASCHLPRHAIRARRNDHIMELTICFECRNAELYRDGKHIQHKVLCEDTIHSAQTLFSQTVQKYHLPMAKE